jgi:hypothetical protein
MKLEVVVIRFLRDESGRVFGGSEKFQKDPYWRDVLFYDYFHKDNGAGIGASHRTGWTGDIANLIEIFGARCGVLSGRRSSSGFREGERTVKIPPTLVARTSRWTRSARVL